MGTATVEVDRNDPTVVVHDGRAMGCATHLVVVIDGPSTAGPDPARPDPARRDPACREVAARELVARANRRIAALESRWSRFLADSDISRLNAADGEAVDVHPDTVTLVTAMVQAWHATAGAFDPTLLGALVGLGYATSWEDPDRRSVAGPAIARRGRPDLIEIGRDEPLVRLPAGTALDAGGIGKGLAADLVATDLIANGASGALVSIGGDLRVQGRSPGRDGWSIGIDDPNHPGASRAQVRLVDGGVATSGTDRRHWVRDGVPVHHLLDPRSGTPAHHRLGTRRLVGATVVAGTAAWAEAWTKALMVLGPDEALPAVEAAGLAADVVFDDGTTRSSSTWARYASTTTGEQS